MEPKKEKKSSSRNNVTKTAEEAGNVLTKWTLRLSISALSIVTAWGVTIVTKSFQEMRVDINKVIVHTAEKDAEEKEYKSGIDYKFQVINGVLNTHGAWIEKQRER